MKLIKLTILEARHLRDAINEIESAVADDYVDMDLVNEAKELIEAAINAAEDEPI